MTQAADNRTSQLQATIMLQQSRIEQLEIQLRDSYIDVGTGIANRAAFEKAISNEWSRCHREENLFSLIVIDCDYFKLVNDSYGHQMGDALLRAIALTVEQQCHRPGDLAARYGGDEFVVLLPGSDASGAIRVGDRIVRAVRKLTIAMTDDITDEQICIGATVSVGVATAQPSAWSFNQAEGCKKLFHAADLAAKEAKKRRNCGKQFRAVIRP